MQRFLTLGASLLAGLCLLLLFGAWLRGGRVDPVAWSPSEAWVLAEDGQLEAAERLGEGLLHGPEDVDLDPEGRLIAGLADGRLVRLALTPGAAVETLVETGGRPLGLAWDATGGMIVADARQGLLRWHPTEGLQTLTTASDGLPFGFTDDVDVAPDGTIYFSDASWRYGVGDHVVDLLDGRPRGRLLRYDPTTRRTETLLADLAFANGVAVAPDGAYVLVNETWRYRVMRYWVSGPKAGRSEVFIRGLPGFPDGLSRGQLKGETVFWLPLFAPRKAIGDWVAEHPFFRRIMLGLPRETWPHPRKEGIVLALDERGTVRATLRDPTGERVSGLTSVQQVGETLYFGSLEQPYAARVALPPG